MAIIEKYLRHYKPMLAPSEAQSEGREMEFMKFAIITQRVRGAIPQVSAGQNLASRPVAFYRRRGEVDHRS